MKKLTLSILIAFFILVSPVKAEVYNYNLILNGGFDNFYMGWEQTNCDEIYNWMVDLSYEGFLLDIGTYLMLGVDWDEKESVQQTVTLPDTAGRITLSFLLNFFSVDSTNQDYFEIIIKDSDTGEYYVHGIRHYADGNTDDWERLEYNLTQYKGKKIDIIFAGERFTDAGPGTTHIGIDQIRVQAKSKSEFYGYVQNKGQSVENASIQIKDPKDTLIWTGRTDGQGVFFISKIKKYKYIKVIVKSNGLRRVFKRKTKWGYRHNETFKLKGSNSLSVTSNYHLNK